MIIKDKAIELVNEFSRLFVPINLGLNRKHYAKQCAIIAVDELISETGSTYWYDVKKEIEKL